MLALLDQALALPSGWPRSFGLVPPDPDEILGGLWR